MNEVTAAWPSYRATLNPPVDNATLQTELPALLARLDALVSAYEAQAQRKITWLRVAQFTFLVAAFLLLAWGYRLVHRGLIRPLAVLGNAAQEIGVGHLATPIPLLPDNELGRLAQTMETMRQEISSYQTALEKQVAQRTAELTGSFEFSQDIVRQLDSEQLLQSVTGRARDLMQGQAASFCVLGEQGRMLELVAGSGHGRDYLGRRQSIDRGIALPVIHEQQTVVTKGGCANCGFLYEYPHTSCIAAPLQINGQAIGALCVVRPHRPFNADESRALTLLANAAAVALENARLTETGKQQARENAALAERERLAAELHDNLAQTLGALYLSVDMLSRQLATGDDGQAHVMTAETQANLKMAYAPMRMALTGLRDTTPDAGNG